MSLFDNTTSLQEVLEKVNALESGGAASNSYTWTAASDGTTNLTVSGNNSDFTEFYNDGSCVLMFAASITIDNQPEVDSFVYWNYGLCDYSVEGRLDGVGYVCSSQVLTYLSSGAPTLTIDGDTLTIGATMHFYPDITYYVTLMKVEG